MNTPIETAIIARLVHHFRTTREMDWSISTDSVNATEARFVCTLDGESKTYDVVLHQDGNLDVQHRIGRIEHDLVHSLFVTNTPAYSASPPQPSILPLPVIEIDIPVLPLPEAPVSISVEQTPTQAIPTPKPTSTQTKLPKAVGIPMKVPAQRIPVMPTLVSTPPFAASPTSAAQASSTPRETQVTQPSEPIAPIIETEYVPPAPLVNQAITPLPSRLRSQAATPANPSVNTPPFPNRETSSTTIAAPMVNTPLPRRMTASSTTGNQPPAQEKVVNIQGLGQWQYWIDKNEINQWCVHLQNKDTTAEYNEDVKTVISTFGDVLHKTITLTKPEFASNIAACIYTLEKNQFTWDAALQKTNAPLVHEIVLSAHDAAKTYGQIKEPEHIHAQVEQWSFVLKCDKTLADDAWMIQLQHPQHHTELTQDPFLRSKIAELALEDDSWWLLVATPLAEAIEKIENLGVTWNQSLQLTLHTADYDTANRAHNQAAMQRDNKANAAAAELMKENQDYQKKLNAVKEQNKPGPFGDALDSLF